MLKDQSLNLKFALREKLLRDKGKDQIKECMTFNGEEIVRHSGFMFIEVERQHYQAGKIVMKVHQ